MGELVGLWEDGEAYVSDEVVVAGCVFGGGFA